MNAPLPAPANLSESYRLERLIHPDELRDLVEKRLESMLDLQLLPVSIVEDTECVYSDPERYSTERHVRYVCKVTPDPLTVRLRWYQLDNRSPVFSSMDEHQYVMGVVHGIRLCWQIAQWSVDDLGVVAWLNFEEEVGRREFGMRGDV